VRHLSERFWPIVLALGAGAGFFYWYSKIPDPKALIVALVTSALTLSGTLLGFLLTITTIMNAIDTRRMRAVKDGGAYPLLEHYLRNAIWLNIAVVSMVFVVPFFDTQLEAPRKIAVLHAVQLALVAWAWFASIRFTVVFIRLLSGGKS
jgi:hypothetical protein